MANAQLVGANRQNRDVLDSINDNQTSGDQKTVIQHNDGKSQKDVSVQNPLPTDSDSIYVKDIDIENSDNGNFSGSVTNYFDNLFSINSDTTSNNPKTIKIWFKRSIQLYSIGFGCNESGKNFSNIKIKIFGSDEAIRETVDDSANDTKYTSRTYDFAPSKANGVIIEFHTADEVCLSNIIIWKATNSISQLVAVDEVTGNVESIKSREGALNVSPEFNNDIPADYYLYQTTVTPTITSDMTIDDVIVNVDDTTGVVVGHAITFYEDISMYQSIVKATTATTITLSSPIDYAFTTAAIVEVGIWNMAVDGSVTPQVFSIKAPPGRDMHVHTMNASILSSLPYTMDDGTFGGLPALTNGFIFRLVDGITKNLALVVNNLGFWEIGFATQYADKAPTGQFGFRARKDIPNNNGVAIDLTHEDAAELQTIVQDDLTGLDLLASTVNGHMAPT